MSQQIEFMTLVQNKDGSWRSWDPKNDDCMDNSKVIDVMPVRENTVEVATEEIARAKQIEISAAVGRWVRASAKFDAASEEFTDASKELRDKLGANRHFVAEIDFDYYIVNSDSYGNFSVNPVVKI